MENEILGLVLIGVMLLAIFIGFPISFTLIFLGFVFGYIGFGPLVFYLMTFQFSSVMLEQTLSAVPLFIFMGLLMEQAGLMERLFKAVQLMLSRVSGSLYLAVLFVSTIFAAATGTIGAQHTMAGGGCGTARVQKPGRAPGCRHRPIVEIDPAVVSHEENPHGRLTADAVVAIA